MSSLRAEQTGASGLAGPACKPHHWLIESPNGTPNVSGTCKKCGATRLYQTSGEEGRPGNFNSGDNKKPRKKAIGSVNR